MSAARSSCNTNVPSLRSGQRLGSCPKRPATGKTDLPAEGRMAEKRTSQIPPEKSGRCHSGTSEKDHRLPNSDSTLALPLSALSQTQNGCDESGECGEDFDQKRTQCDPGYFRDRTFERVAG